MIDTVERADRDGDPDDHRDLFIEPMLARDRVFPIGVLLLGQGGARLGHPRDASAGCRDPQGRDTRVAIRVRPR
ncbi:hypothetical protein BOX37_29190 [Nocardia mangyaensis]|uniref:Uncharacterized protein n=1 Tax=Nocardia mangyaensis TaxID=2213200 RepID=A0A1J0VZI2_9NOCA|nr:hypothetical protein BOX37_29190 [Nocardia mangyaensis]